MCNRSAPRSLCPAPRSSRTAAGRRRGKTSGFACLGRGTDFACSDRGTGFARSGNDAGFARSDREADRARSGEGAGFARPGEGAGARAKRRRSVFRARGARKEGKERFTVSVHPLFLLYGGFCCLRGQLFPFLAATVCAVMHEFGHAWYAARIGCRLSRLCLLPGGAMVTGDIEGISLADEIRLALAGPAVNAASAVLFAALWWVAPATYAFTDVAAFTSASLFAVNLLPALPLDGGRVLYCIIARRRGEPAAQRRMRVVAVLFAAASAALFAAGAACGAWNVSVLFFAACVLEGSFGGKDCRYERIRYDRTARLRRGMEVRRVALSALCPVKKALAFLERGRWLELLLFDGEGRFVGALSQAQFCAIAERADIYRPIADYLAAGDTVFAKNGKENETFCQKIKISSLQNEEVYGKIKDAMYILRER